jgi:glutamate 5-kinase
MLNLDRNRISRVVVKVGSSTLTHSTGKFNLKKINALVTALADLKNSGRDVILVTSGAVAAGMAKLGMSERPHEVRAKQAVAAVGQCSLLHIYDKMFSEYGHIVGQVLMTKDVLEHESSRTNAKNTFETLLELGVIPVVNENDTISTYEIERLAGFGDNDRLSAYVAVLCGADLLIILSDIDGLFDCDPRENDEAKLIPVVRKIDDKIRALAGGAGRMGTGGMAAKLTAAEITMAAGIDMVITNGASPESVLDICEGRLRGTLFAATKGKDGAAND